MHYFCLVLQDIEKANISKVSHIGVLKRKVWYPYPKKIAQETCNALLFQVACVAPNNLVGYWKGVLQLFSCSADLIIIVLLIFLSFIGKLLLDLQNKPNSF